MTTAVLVVVVVLVALMIAMILTVASTMICGLGSTYCVRNGPASVLVLLTCAFAKEQKLASRGYFSF